MKERNRSKAGRMARLKGNVEKIEALEGADAAVANAEIGQLLADMWQKEKEGVN